MSIPHLLLALAAPGLSAAQGLPPELATLVPEESVLLVEVRSLDALARELEDFRARSSPEAAAITSTELLQRLAARLDLPGDLAQVDPTRPAALALRVGRGEALPTFIVPTRDPQRWIASTEDSPEKLSFATAGRYVACTLGDPPLANAGVSRLCAGWPDVLLCARVDAARAIARFRPELDALLDRVERLLEAGALASPDATIDPTEALDGFLSFARSLVESADRVELTLDARAGEHALRVELANRAGSPLARLGGVEPIDYLDLARRVDPAAALQLVGCYSHGAWTQLSAGTFGELFDGLERSARLPEVLTDGLRALVEHALRIQALAGRPIAASADLGASGMRLAICTQPSDLAAFEGAWRALGSEPALAPLGLIVAAGERVELAGVSTSTWRVALELGRTAGLAPSGERTDAVLQGFDALVRSLFGGERATIALATFGERVLTLLGGDDAWRAAAAQRWVAGGEPSQELARLAGELEGANPGYGVHVDLARLLPAMARVLLEARPLEPSQEELLDALRALGERPAPFALHWAVRGERWSFGARAGAAGLAELARRIDAAQAAERRNARIEADLGSIGIALWRWAAEHDGNYPKTLSELARPDADGEPYVSFPLDDPWGRPYLYELEADGRGFVVRTLGADGRVGGRGADADRSSEGIPFDELVPADDDQDASDGERDGDE